MRNQNPQFAETSERWPRMWRFAIIAFCVLILCSCKMSGPQHGGSYGQAGANSSIPPQAFTGAPVPPPQPPMGPPGMELGVPVPYSPTGPWRPDGIAGPWPEDEYVCDGGNAGPPVRVVNKSTVRGLEMEDTVAHYETLDGQTLVEPSNRVCLYSPRFGAVRQVVNVEIGEQTNRAAGVFNPTKLAAPATTEKLGTGTQHLQAIDEIGSHPAEIVRMKQGRGVVSNEIGPREFENRFRAYENFTVIRRGTLVESEGAVLAKATDAAIAWTKKQAVQVVLDEKSAKAETSVEKSHEVYAIGSSPNPRLRLVKVASTPFAEPGDEVSFTLRFDNIGNQTIKKVTILDSLNTRLEYVPDSAQASLKASFSTHVNEGDSVVVRCELADPLPPGKGGVLRFRCRVR